MIFVLKEGWRSFRTLGIGGLLTLAALTTTLTLGALTAEGFLLLSRWNRALLEKFEIEAFLGSDIKDEKVGEVEVEIRRLPEAARTQIITRQDAAERFKSEFGSDLFDALGYNPLPPSVIVTLKPEAVQRRSWGDVSKRIKSIAGVEDVIYQGELVSEVDRFYARTGTALIWLIGIALAASLGFTAMTIAAAIKTRSEYIQIVLMCGGSRLMARGPFIALGGYYGLAAAVIAAAIAMGISALVTVGWEIDMDFPFNWIPILAAAGVLLGGSTASWVAGKKIRQV